MAGSERALTERQKKILLCIADALDDQGYPPTIREIGEQVGISSTSVVNYHLNKLRERGLIDRDDRVSRGLKITEAGEEQLGGRRAPVPASAEAPERRLFRVPIAGTIAAGQPIPVLVEPDPDDDYIEIGRELVGRNESVFALHVKGDSMIDALVNDGDIVVLEQAATAENGDMVAAWIKDREETTLKRFYQEGARVRLQPANPTMEPLYLDAGDVEIQGRVVAVIRSLEGRLAS